jgi:hypothetical protein
VRNGLVGVCSMVPDMRLVMRVSFLPGEKEHGIPAKLVFCGPGRKGAGKEMIGD